MNSVSIRTATASRRALFRGAGASALVAGTAIATAALGHGATDTTAPAHTQPAGDDAELIRLGDAILMLWAETVRLSLIEDDLPGLDAKTRFNREKIRPLSDRHHELMPQLTVMAATTMAGFRAKARVLQTFSNCSPGYADPDQDDALAWSLANDLLGVASVWREYEDEDEEPLA
jgi:hypothetical protein